MEFDSLAIAAKSAAHAIVRNQRLLTNIDFLMNGRIMIKTKKIYQVMDFDELWDKNIDFMSGIWCTDNFECRNMGMKDAKKNSECISGCIVDESIKDCLIFTFFDPANYSVEKDTFIEILYKDLLEDFCKEIMMVCCMESLSPDCTP